MASFWRNLFPSLQPWSRLPNVGRPQHLTLSIFFYLLLFIIIPFPFFPSLFITIIVIIPRPDYQLQSFLPRMTFHQSGRIISAIIAGSLSHLVGFGRSAILFIYILIYVLCVYVFFVDFFSFSGLQVEHLPGVFGNSAHCGIILLLALCPWAS